jgi:hypothetical protein
MVSQDGFLGKAFVKRKIRTGKPRVYGFDVGCASGVGRISRSTYSL